MRAKVLRVAAALVSLLVAGQSDLAAARPKKNVEIVMVDPKAAGIGEVELADGALVTAAQQSFGSGGFAALQAHLPALGGVLARAPADYPRIVSGKGLIIARGHEAQGMALMLGIMSAQGAGAGKIRLAGTPNVYPDAALLLGSNANEYGRHEEALAYLDRGLALQPDELPLLIEKSGTLTVLRRPAEALTTVDAALAAAGGEGADLRARLLRRRGLALIELQRLDEAEKALKESLALVPDDPLTLNELDYIAALRAGATPTPPVMAPKTPAPIQDDVTT